MSFNNYKVIIGEYSPMIITEPVTLAKRLVVILKKALR